MDLFLLSLFSLIIFILSILYLWKKLTYHSPNLPPGPLIKPFIGELFNLKPRLFLAFDKLSQQYGEIVFFKLLTKNAIVINSYRGVKEAFTRHEFSGRWRSKFIDDFTHHSGIVMMDGEIWKEHRRKSIKILRDFGVGKNILEQSIQSEAIELCDHINLLIEQNQLIDTNHLFSITTANIICNLVFGARPGYKESSEYTLLLDKLKMTTQDTSLITQFISFLPGFEKVMLFFNFVPSVKKIHESIIYTHEFIIQKIAEHRDKFSQQDEPSDFIFAYLKEQTKSNFDDWKIIRIVLELFIAGTDTTSTQLTWLTLLLAQHDEVREKAVNEIRQHCGMERIVSMDDKRKLNYTQAMIDEVIRFSVITPTGGIPHRAMEDTQLFQYQIPKDTLVFFNFYSICRDPNLWKYPTTFNPENFLNENGQYQPNEQLIPFSIGKRVCLGESLARMELFIFIVSLLQNFRFELKINEENNNGNEQQQLTLEEIMLGGDGAIRAPAKHFIKFIPL